MAQERKGGLGRGLAALIPSSTESADKTGKTGRLGDGAADVILGGIPGAPTVVPQAERPKQPIGMGARYQEIPVGEIFPNPKQPRQVFDEDELAELVHSIKEFGLLQPIVVRESDQGYELIMGERRWRASSKAGLKHIPAIVRETNDADMLRDALLENIHRVQLNPLEEAAAYQQLLQEFGVTQEQLADRLGRSRPRITNSIRLLNLPVTVQRRVAAGVLSAGHARALLGVKAGAEQQEKLADRVVAEGLSVRATEEAVTLLNRHGAAEDKPKREPAPSRNSFPTRPSGLPTNGTPKSP